MGNNDQVVIGKESCIMIYELVKFKDNPEALSNPTQPYVFSQHDPEDTKKLAEAIVARMYELKGVGISANQLGIPWSIFAIRGEPADFVFFNPNITYYSPDRFKEEEACLSFPGLVVPIKRSHEIRLRFSDLNGDTSAETFKGLTARVCQHEFLHLQGRMWFEGCNRFHLERAIRKAKNGGNDYSHLGLMRYAQ